MTGEFQGRVLGRGKGVGVQEDGERVRKRQAEGAKCQSVDHTFFCVVRFRTMVSCHGGILKR